MVYLSFPLAEASTKKGGGGRALVYITLVVIPLGSDAVDFTT